MATVTVHVACPTLSCEDGIHYVRVEYNLAAPSRYFTGWWGGKDDCVCELTPGLLRTVVGMAEEMVATGEVS